MLLENIKYDKSNNFMVQNPHRLIIFGLFPFLCKAHGMPEFKSKSFNDDLRHISANIILSKF